MYFKSWTQSWIWHEYCTTSSSYGDLAQPVIGLVKDTNCKLRSAGIKGNKSNYFYMNCIYWMHSMRNAEIDMRIKWLWFGYMRISKKLRKIANMREKGLCILLTTWFQSRPKKMALLFQSISQSRNENACTIECSDIHTYTYVCRGEITMYNWFGLVYGYAYVWQYVWTRKVSECRKRDSMFPYVDRKSRIHVEKRKIDACQFRMKYEVFIPTKGFPHLLWEIRKQLESKKMCKISL